MGRRGSGPAQAMEEPMETFGAGALAAFFERRGDAERAVERIYELGLDHDRVTMVEHHDDPDSVPERPGQGGGLFGVLSDAMVPGHERYETDAGTRRKGYLVTVEADDAAYGPAKEILAAQGIIERDDRAT
jgi:hypothetical protein